MFEKNEVEKCVVLGSPHTILPPTSAAQPRSMNTQQQLHKDTCIDEINVWEIHHRAPSMKTVFSRKRLLSCVPRTSAALSGSINARGLRCRWAGLTIFSPDSTTPECVPLRPGNTLPLAAALAPPLPFASVGSILPFAAPVPFKKALMFSRLDISDLARCPFVPLSPPSLQMIPMLLLLIPLGVDGLRTLSSIANCAAMCDGIFAPIACLYSLDKGSVQS